jgi:hypothetical protein
MSNDIPADIVDTINRENSSLVLMGAAQRVFGGNIFGGKVEAVLNQVNCNVGVFLYKNFIDLKSILLCYSEKKETFDLFALISSITGFQKKEVTIIYDDIKPTDQIIKRYVQNNYKIEKINYLDGEISEGTVAFFGYEKWKEFELTDYYNKIQILGLPIIILRSNEGKV